MLGIVAEKSRVDPYQSANSLYTTRQRMFLRAATNPVSISSHHQIRAADSAVEESGPGVGGSSLTRDDYERLDVGGLYPTDVVFSISKYGIDIRYRKCAYPQLCSC
jgi:hypothetical protein